MHSGEKGMHIAQRVKGMHSGEKVYTVGKGYAAEFTQVLHNVPYHRAITILITKNCNYYEHRLTYV